MTIITTVKARDHLSDVLNRAAYGQERIVLTRRGKPLVAVISIEDLELLERLEDALDGVAIEEAWIEQGDDPLESWDDVKVELGL